MTACASRAWKLAVFLVWNTEDALDVVQAACLVAASKADAIPTDDPWPWFARVVTLEALKLRSSRAKAAMLGENLGKERAVITVDAALEAERRELQTKLREALEELPVEQRDALTLTHIAGLTVRDAASSLGVSSSTVDRRVQEGLSSLRQKLDRKPALLSAALIALKVENPPQGMNAALTSWLGAVHGSAVSGTITGASTMKIAIFAALGFVILACAAGGCFWHFHHDAAGEHMREIHESMWRAFHGK